MCETIDTGRISYRDFRMEDYEAVCLLWERAGLPYRPQGRDRRDTVEAELAGGTAVFLVAEADGGLIGTVLGTDDGRKGWINRLAVAPGYRRRGVARHLVLLVEARLEARGRDISSVLIESDNAASLAFFSALGFVHDPEIEYFSRRRSVDT